MALIKWDPFEEILSSHFSSVRDLSTDLYEDGDNLIAEVSLPGMKQEEISVCIENQVLKVSCRREEKREKKDKNFYSKEIKTGSFERFIGLPYLVDVAKVTADYEKGILKIVMPKIQGGSSSKIKITAK